ITFLSLVPICNQHSNRNLHSNCNHGKKSVMNPHKPTLLAIEVSPRSDHSISRKLTAEFVRQWKAAHADGSVVFRDLIDTRLPFVDQSWIQGAFTPPDTHSAEAAEAIRVSDNLVAELKAADHIVLGTPMY